jgi:DNA-binding MarR family transcriptional regulator
MCEFGKNPTFSFHYPATIRPVTGLICCYAARVRRLAAMSEVSLTGWMKALIAYVRSGEPDLTNRQMALLMLVYLTPGPHTVRGLARVLGVSKPVVTRALNTLGALGYLRRERDQDDRRNVFVVRTSSGAEFLEGFKSNLREGDASSAAHRPIIGQAPAYAHQR